MLSFYCSAHLEGFPPQSSQSLPGSKLARPPHDPEIGFFPKNNPTDMMQTIVINMRNIISVSNMFIF